MLRGIVSLFDRMRVIGRTFSSTRVCGPCFSSECVATTRSDARLPSSIGWSWRCLACPLSWDEDAARITGCCCCCFDWRRLADQSRMRVDERCAMSVNVTRRIRSIRRRNKSAEQVTRLSSDVDHCLLFASDNRRYFTFSGSSSNPFAQK